MSDITHEQWLKLREHWYDGGRISETQIARALDEACDNLPEKDRLKARLAAKDAAIERLSHERNVLQKICAERSDEIERLREYEAKVQEAEGRVCPEDVGFEEYIRHLLAKLALAAEDAAGRDEEYICKCGVRVVPHRCPTGQDF